MKHIIRKLSLSLMLGMSIIITPKKVHAQGASVNFQIFYDELSPYGNWVSNPDYGYVWVPNVAPGFTPYGTNGHWVLTDQGWTWFSNYSWGWAPFHYGRWYTDPIYGAMWVPGNEWGPGWVTWRRSPGYYGWAPIGPGVSISVAYGNGYNVPHNQWRFVRDRDFGRTNINNYYVNTTNNVTIIKNSTVINNTRTEKSHNVTYNAGPERAEVEKSNGRKINPVLIKENDKPGERMDKNQLQIYRPQVQKENGNGSKPAPKKVTEIKDVNSSSYQNNDGSKQKSNHQDKQQPANSKNTAPAKQDNPSKNSDGEKQHSNPQHNKDAEKKNNSQPDKPKEPYQQDQQKKSDEHPTNHPKNNPPK